MTDTITRCPQCSTSFRITPDQLKKARGAVRCGSCLYVFNAMENIVHGTPKHITPKQSSPKQSSPKQSAPKQNAFKSTSQVGSPEHKVTKQVKHSESVKKETTQSNDSLPQNTLVDSTTNFQPQSDPITHTTPVTDHNAPKDTKPSPVNEEVLRESNLTPNKEHLAKKTSSTDQEGKIPSDNAETNNAATNETSKTHFVSEEEKSTRLDTTQLGSISEKEDVFLKDIDDDFLISDDMDLEESGSVGSGMDELAEFEFTAKRWNVDSGSLFDRSPKKDDPIEEDTHTDESWALSMLSELESGETHVEPIRKSVTPSSDNPEDGQAIIDDDLHAKLEKNLHSNDDEDINTRFDPNRTGSFDAIDDDFMDKFAANFDEEPPEPIERRKTPDLRPPPDSEFEGTQARNWDMEDDEENEVNTGLSTSPEDRYDMLQSFEPEPLEVTFRQDEPGEWVKKLAFWASNVVLALLLIAQVGWIKFDTWSRVHPYRDAYTVMCPVIGCTIPPVYDYSKVRITLVVREHPTLENALQADAVLLNTAGFEQPFPHLSLAFTDINDQPIAQRTFLPSEYLAGEMAGARNMPKSQPIHISLELLDPGDKAVNYKAFIPSES
ncbi:DUF3426 domain-containing protein [Marinibactrum halimedae]|uniref:Zinc finger/thioredoxin putative domain-containing protein n=1 Tax=Marinibactrum halimedae TaxID=1444977 RepID=A0AA37WMI9_9GAMM|nr:DUF3426 domain-containing protein [Marinibactrum halimedae]MCD9459937.1 zinc-ribbon domain-containing protein [Marinibactrum halimedae]GLS25206.1 hypothetical protein GCM10007877_09200 [Marinibactrum halimedae]